MSDGEACYLADMILLDPEDGIAQVVDYKLNGYDHTELWRCRKVNSAALNEVVLTISDGEVLPDALDNPLSWLIVSDRFMDMLRSKCGRDIQVLKCWIIDQTGRELPGYNVVNVLRCIDALDLGRSTIDFEDGEVAMVYDWIFRKNALPSSEAIFRDKNFPFSVFFARPLALMCDGLTGFAFLACKAM